MKTLMIWPFSRHRNTERAHPGGSWVEIGARKAVLKCELEVRLYRYDGHFFIASVAGIAEVDIPSILPVETDDETLGRVVCDHLLVFKPDTPYIRNRTPRDWPAYTASRAGSVKHFQENAWAVAIKTINSAVAIHARPCKTLQDFDIHAEATADHAQIGDLIRKCLRAGEALREKGLI